MAGTAVQYLAQQPLTMALIKDNNMTITKESYRFGVLFDGSAIAEKVLRTTISMAADHDRLTCITVVETGMDHTTIEPKIRAITGTRQCDIVILENTASTTIKSCIKQYFVEQDENDDYVDFCAVGNRGLNVGNAVVGENFLGTVAQAMISMRKLNVIFVP